MLLFKRAKSTPLEDELMEVVNKYEEFLNYLSYQHPKIDILSEWKTFSEQWEKENKQ